MSYSGVHVSKVFVPHPWSNKYELHKRQIPFVCTAIRVVPWTVERPVGGRAMLFHRSARPSRSDHPVAS